MYSQRPRIRILSIRPKMSQHHQQQIMRVPKQELAVATGGGGNSNRRYAAAAAATSSSSAQNRQNNGTTRNSSGAGKSSGGSPTITIEEIPNHAYLDSINNQTGGSNAKFDEEKLPVFLIKLWNIVEDSNLQSIVHWDESGASFHIADPYSFCRNVLPHFFKHNNLNSLIRQLNMYGFRKMTPLNQGGLTRTESDQDHLEFSHPCFIQNRPELLGQIKRKQSNKVTEEKQVTEQTQQNLEVVMAEMRSMREKAKNMENKMNALTKENRDIWDQMSTMRAQHSRQQAYFKKLLHFLVSVMQPGLGKRVAKRLAIGTDFHDSPGASSSKRARTSGNVGGGVNGGDDGPNHNDMVDLLEFLQREAQEQPQFRRFSTNNDTGGPLISEVTDEFGNSPGGTSGGFSDAFPGMPRYSDHHQHHQQHQQQHHDSRDTSPHPHISHPSSSANLNLAARDEHRYSEDPDNLLLDEDVGGHDDDDDHQPMVAAPASMYMGSGALTHENVHRGPPVTAAQKRNYQGVPTTGQIAAGGMRNQAPSQQQQQHPTTRMAYKMAKQQPSQQFAQSNQSAPSSQNHYQQQPAAAAAPFSSIPPQISYQNAQNQQQNVTAPTQNNQRLAICDDDQRLDTISPLNVSFDRQLSQEMQNYLLGYDQELDNFRGMMHTQNWDEHSWDTFGDILPEDEEDQHQQQQQQNHSGIPNHLGNLNLSQRQLALEGIPSRSDAEPFGVDTGFGEDDGRDLLDPLLNEQTHHAEGFEVPDPNYSPLPDEEIFPHSPVLRTPSPSDLLQ